MPNDITMTEITSPSKIWKVGYTVDAAGTKTKNLITSGTFLDRNIGVEIITPAISGSIGGSASAGKATADITNVDSISATTTAPSGTAGTDYWRIKATATGTAGSYTPKYTVTNAGWLASTVNGNAQTVDVTSDITGKFLYIPKATVGGSGGNISVISGGYLPEGTELASMNTAAATVSASKQATSPTIAKTSTTASGATNVANGNATTTPPSSGCFVSIQATAPVTNLDITKTVDTAGYLGANTQISVSASTTEKTGSVYYVPVASTSISQGTTSVSGTTATRGTASWNSGWLSSGNISAATFANTATSGVSYVDISGTTAAPVLVSGNYLYINKGYTDNLKISLAKLVPNDATITITNSTESAQILSGYAAYNKDGILLSGNIPTKTAQDITFDGRMAKIPSGYYATETTANMSLAEITSGTATINSVSYTYNSTNNNFNVTGSTDISAPIVNTAGYISSSDGIKNAKSNGAILQTTVAKISLTSEKTSGDLTKAPTLARTAKPFEDTWTDAANGSAIITKPTSGPYVQIDAAASTNTVTIKGKVSADGYGTTTQYIAANTTYTVGAAKATTRYIPIKVGVAAADTASADVNISTIDGSNAGVNISDVIETKMTTEPTSGYYIAMTASGSGSSKVTTAGWFQAGELPAASTTATKYFPITPGSCTIDGGVLSTSGYSKTDLDLTLTSGSDSNMSNISIGAKDTTNYAYYFKVNGSTPAVSGTTSASVTPITDNHTAGYIPEKPTTNFRNSQSATPSVKVNATSKSTYVNLKAAGITYSGGGLSNTKNYTGTPIITLEEINGNDSTNMANYRLGTQDTTNYPYYFQIKATTAELTGTTTVTRADYKDTRTAGYLPGRNSTTILASETSSPTVTVNAAINTTYYFSMKKATMTVEGNNTVNPTAAIDGTHATLVTTNNSGISVIATGGGTASVRATATTNAAGYAPANIQLGSKLLEAPNNTTATGKYLKEVEIVKPNSGTREFGIKVPNGDSTITFVFHVDSSGNVTIDNEYSLTY